MARISVDGTHTAITSAPGWKSEDELEKQYQDTYNTGGTGPTADQINAAYAQNTQKTQNLESSEKNLNYSGKYKNAKKEIVIQACQSWIDLQSETEANWAVLEEMEKDLIEYPENEELGQRHDELLRTTEKQEQALPFYEKTFWDFFSEYLELADEEEQANQTYWKDYEDWEKDQNFFTRIVSDYQGNDMELLSEDALVYLESFQEGCWQYTEKEIDRRLEEIQQEKDSLHSYHSEVALLGSGGVSSLMEKQKMLENEEAALRTEKYQLEGVKTRFRQKCEAVRDPDFLRYVEQGQARESSAYDTAVFGSALNAMMGSEYSVPNNTDPFEDTKAMDPMDKKMYYYFLGKDPDSPAAVEYQNSQQRQINKRRNDEYLERIQKGAAENPFGYGISSGIPNFYGAFMTVGDILAERARYGGEDLLADPNTPGQRMLKGVQAGREPGLEGIENPGLKKAARYGYAFMDSSPAYLLNWLGAPGAGAAYMGILRGAQGYTAAANQGMTMEDALQEGKAKGALGMFLANRAFQNTRNAQGGFSRKPGNMAGQEASSGLMVPPLPGASPEAGAHALINQLGTQGAFQYLMESNGYSMGNVLARPSAEQAYAILKSANLSPKAIQVLLEDNGYPSDIVFKSSSLSPEHGSSAYHTLSNILEESGLQPDEIQSLLRSKGHYLDDDPQLPGLLKDDTGELLQREEASSGEMLELPKIGEELGDDRKGVEKSRKIDTIERSELLRKYDPMFEVTGAAEDFDPEGYKRMMDDMVGSGVEVCYGEGSIGYSPGIYPGQPGQFHIAPGKTSYSGCLHEYKHFCDDRAAGYLGMMAAFTNPEERIQMERDAFQLEIDLALEYNRPDIAEKLKILLDEEIKKIEKRKTEQ